MHAWQGTSLEGCNKKGPQDCVPDQATSVGQAVAGFGVSALSFLTLWAAPGMEPGEVRRPADVAGAASAYFGLSAAVMAVSVGAYWWLQHLPFWHFHTRTAVCLEGKIACMPSCAFICLALRAHCAGMAAKCGALAPPVVMCICCVSFQTTLLQAARAVAWHAGDLKGEEGLQGGAGEAVVSEQVGRMLSPPCCILESWVPQKSATMWQQA